MQGAHLLRKYEPSEWGGTETAVLQLLGGLADHGVKSTVWCPATKHAPTSEPFACAGHEIRRFRAFVPVAGIPTAQRQQLVTLGGNLMSLDLPWRLWREPRLDFIHSHALNRLAGIGQAVARRRHIPFVITIHGGFLDLPALSHSELVKPLQGGWEWGKIFGWILQSRRIMETADAVLTCNPREAELLRDRYPRQRVIVQPHSVPIAVYERDCRAAAQAALPEIVGRDLLLCVARIDPQKNQDWLVQQLPALRQRFPKLLVVLAGSTTNHSYEAQVRATIARLELGQHVRYLGGLPPGGEVLVGLMQTARALVLPSVSETFGLVILEAWAAGTAVICSRTSGAASLVRHRENGWLFDIGHGPQFLAAAEEALAQPGKTRALAEAGHKLARSDHDTSSLARRVKDLYQSLTDEIKSR